MGGKPGLRVQQNSLLGLDGRLIKDGPPVCSASEQVCGTTIIAMQAIQVVRTEMYDSLQGIPGSVTKDSLDTVKCLFPRIWCC